MGKYPPAGTIPDPLSKRLNDAVSILMRIRDEIMMKIGKHESGDGAAVLHELTDLLALVNEALKTLTVDDHQLIEAILEGSWPTSNLLP